MLATGGSMPTACRNAGFRPEHTTRTPRTTPIDVHVHWAASGRQENTRPKGTMGTRTRCQSGVNVKAGDRLG